MTTMTNVLDGAAKVTEQTQEYGYGMVAFGVLVVIFVILFLILLQFLRVSLKKNHENPKLRY